MTESAIRPGGRDGTNRLGGQGVGVGKGGRGKGEFCVKTNEYRSTASNRTITYLSTGD